jgi:hypothetical protein
MKEIILHGTSDMKPFMAVFGDNAKYLGNTCGEWESHFLVANRVWQRLKLYLPESCRIDKVVSKTLKKYGKE